MQSAPASPGEASHRVRYAVAHGRRRRVDPAVADNHCRHPAPALVNGYGMTLISLAGMYIDKSGSQARSPARQSPAPPPFSAGAIHYSIVFTTSLRNCGPPLPRPWTFLKSQLTSRTTLSTLLRQVKPFMLARKKQWKLRKTRSNSQILLFTNDINKLYILYFKLIKFDNLALIRFQNPKRIVWRNTHSDISLFSATKPP